MVVSEYEYEEELLIMETRLNASKDVKITYEYNDNKKLVIKRENGKIIEKNSYRNGNLVEKWTFYFGIDPCFVECCGQFFIKYDYYE